MLRRDVLKSLVALAAAPSVAFADEPGLQLGEATPFTFDTLIGRARDMAAQEFIERPTFPEKWLKISYDEYRAIWFDGRNAVWENTDTPFRLDVFPPGLYYKRAVDISVLENGQARPVLFSMDVFDSTDKFPEMPLEDTLGYSGLRLRGALEKPGIFQEFVVFQGASYFRAIANGEVYGVSARGLAINTAEASGEEFPDFTAFWVERPAPDQTDVVLYALLDGPSCTGAYRFRIQPGAALLMDVDCQLFARRDMPHYGIGPLTSMFLFDETNRDQFSDFRPAVHDSDGLLIRNGAGETLWRPLANPHELQVSSFSDKSPQGFGLIQRERRFSDFADLEALYHKRPSVWVTPNGEWGDGIVALVEIPSKHEVFDNIVAYWRPKTPLKAGEEAVFAYRLEWSAEPNLDDGLIKVLNTRIGGRPEGGIVMAIDFEPHPDLKEDLGGIDAVLRCSIGEITHSVVQRNPATGGPRLAFTFEPGDAPSAEFRVQLRHEDAPLSEIWLYRWTV